MTVFGVGIRDKIADIKIASRWQRMLERAYCPKYKIKYPTYENVTVDESFLYYSNFERWIISQCNFEYYINGGRSWQLDKDLLSEKNKIYSPMTCCLLPNEINVCLTSDRRILNGTPCGVSWQNSTKKYIVTICINGKNKNLGRYTDIEYAYSIYCVELDNKIKTLAIKWKDFLSLESFTALMNYSLIERRNNQ